MTSFSDTTADNFMKSAINAVQKGIHVNDGDYYDEDGRLICRVCRRPKTEFNNYLKCFAAVDCLCDEQKKERERIEDEKARLAEKVTENRASYLRLCGREKYVRFDEKEFEPGSAPAICLEYARNFEKMARENTGILLIGPAGVGKTHLSRCISSYLIEHGCSALWFDLCSFAEKLVPQDRFQDVRYYEDLLRTTDFIVFDGLGRERRNAFMDSAVIRAIDLRYDAGKPTCFVTEYDADRLASPRDDHEDAVFSRVLEMCASVPVDGPNRRILRHNEKSKRFREIVGGGPGSSGGELRGVRRGERRVEKLKPGDDPRAQVGGV